LDSKIAKSGNTQNLKKIFAEVNNENHQHKIIEIKSKKTDQLIEGVSKRKYSNHGRSLSKFSTKSGCKSK
jgi:hypothetical protein